MLLSFFFLFVELTPTKKLDKLFISLLPRKSVRVVQCFWQLDLIVFHVIHEPKWSYFFFNPAFFCFSLYILFYGFSVSVSLFNLTKRFTSSYIPSWNKLTDQMFPFLSFVPDRFGLTMRLILLKFLFFPPYLFVSSFFEKKKIIKHCRVLKRLALPSCLVWLMQADPPKYTWHHSILKRNYNHF